MICWASGRYQPCKISQVAMIDRLTQQGFMASLLLTGYPLFLSRLHAEIVWETICFKIINFSHSWKIPFSFQARPTTLKVRVCPSDQCSIAQRMCRELIWGGGDPAQSLQVELIPNCTFLPCSIAVNRCINRYLFLFEQHHLLVEVTSARCT